MTAIFDPAYDMIRTRASAEGKPSVLQPLREEAITKLRELGLPTARSEAWRNFSLRSLKDLEFTGAPAQQSSRSPIATDNPSLVFVGGVFQPQLSTLLTDSNSGASHGLMVKAVADITEDELSRLQQLMTLPDESCYQQKDKMRAFQGLLAQSFIHDGVWLKTTQKHTPTVIDVVAIAVPEDGGEAGSASGSKGIAGFPQLFVEVTEGCELEVRQLCVDSLAAATATSTGAETTSSSGVMSLSAPSFYGHVASRGMLKHYLIQRESTAVTHLGKTYVTVEGNGQYDGFQLLQGSGRCRQECDIVMTGAHADIQLNGLYLAEQGSRIDNDTRIHHSSGQTDSRQFYKGVIWDGGEGSFSGQIIVARDSQQVDAHQLNHNLLMGDKAIAHTRPQLAIDADDVKCAHGATIGSLKSDELFYLQSRGISKDRATRMLTVAFCRDVIERVQSRSAKEWLMMELGYSKLF